MCATSMHGVLTTVSLYLSMHARSLFGGGMPSPAHNN